MQDVSEESVKISFDDKHPFCENCADIRRNRTFNKALEYLNDNGCSYCALLAKIVRVHLDKNCETKAISRVVNYPGDILWLNNDDDDIFSDYFGLYVPEGTPSKALVELLGTGRNPCMKTDVITRISYARKLLEHCEREHEECQKKARPEDLPRRLLEISDSSVYLVETLESLGRSEVRYACLSYCWGKGQPLTLTGSNIDEFGRGILIESIPQTLQDAIRVAQGLGLRHIWIDALCIVQDDKSDWDREAPRMGSIYRSAHVTIAAIHATSCREGFLADVSDRWKKHTHVRCINVDGVESDVFVKPEDPMPTTVPRGWATRGWTLQESIFSRRLLSFEEHEFRWRCDRTHKREFSTEDTLSKDEQLLVPIREGSWGAWSRFIRDYLERSFTYEGDRLVAISGFVLEVIRMTGQEYYAGHFSGSDFLLSLSWDTPFGHESNRRTQPYRAPTWSWASIVNEQGNNPIHFPGSAPYSNSDRQLRKPSYLPSADVLDIWTKSSASYGTGAVKDGRLTLGARTFKSKLSRNLDPDAEFLLRMCPDVDLLVTKDTRAYSGNSYYPRRLRLDYQIDLSGSIDVICPRIGSWDGRHFWLLCKTAPGHVDLYERIGIVECRTPLKGDIDIDELAKSRLKETWMEVKII